MGNSRGAVPCFLLPGLLEACSAPSGPCPGAWGPEVQGEGSRGAVGEGLTEADTASGQGLLGLRVPARDRRGREAVCPGVWVAAIGPGQGGEAAAVASVPVLPPGNSRRKVWWSPAPPGGPLPSVPPLPRPASGFHPRGPDPVALPVALSFPQLPQRPVLSCPTSSFSPFSSACSTPFGSGLFFPSCLILFLLHSPTFISSFFPPAPFSTSTCSPPPLLTIIPSSLTLGFMLFGTVCFVLHSLPSSDSFCSLIPSGLSAFIALS